MKYVLLWIFLVHEREKKKATDVRTFTGKTVCVKKMLQFEFFLKKWEQIIYRKDILSLQAQLFDTLIRSFSDLAKKSLWVFRVTSFKQTKKEGISKKDTKSCNLNLKCSFYDNPGEIHILNGLL